ncbi:MAG: BamA/TamA family outer membrane protein [Gemmatimonadaceae bacterium]|nr:BamA/TamA family outer membrane protein [Gemmatimonadaceae bacterium]
MRTSLALFAFATGALAAVRPIAAQDLSCERGDREVRALRFVGNQEYPASVLAATVATLPSSFPGVPLLGERRCLDPVEFARDVQRLATLYRRRGYPDVQVDTLVRTVRPNVIDVTFSIVEGAPMRVSAFVLRGTSENPELADVARDFPLRVGGVFDRSALEAGRDTLVRRLRNRGWPQAEALLAYTTNTRARTADVEVSVVPGARARIGRIALQVESPDGDRQVSDAMIRRALNVESGDWYSARAIIDAQRNLYQTDAFQRVEIQPDSVQPPGDTIVNLTARLVEGDRFAVRGGFGWATLDCFRTQGSLTDRDFLPYAQRLELTARVSKIGIGAPVDGFPELCQGQARSDPYSRTLNYYTSMTLRQPVRAEQARVPSLTLFSSTLSEYLAYLRRTPIGGVLSVTDPFARRASLRSPSTLSYQLELGRTEAEPAFFCAVFNACDAELRNFLQRNNRLAALEFSISRQRVNDPLRPTAGTALRATLRHASTLIGSDRTQQFNRATGDASWYHTLGSATITAHVRAGIVQGQSSGAGVGSFIPPQERLYAGGPTTVRGFRQNELGPAVYIVSGYSEFTENGQLYYRVDSTTVSERVVPTGGNTLIVGNLEAQWPSPVLPKLLQLAAFADAGRLWNRHGTVRGASVTNDGPLVKITPGMGVRVASPFGAIRIDFGYNPYELPAGAAYFNARPQEGIAPLYCVSPGNRLVVRENVILDAPPVQASGSCPSTFRPTRRTGILGRLNPSIWIGQAF